MPAGEDDVGAGEQRGLHVHEALAGASEGRELVHVVVDDEIRIEMAREGERHRRVVPEDARALVLAGEQPVDEAAQSGEPVGRGQAFRQHGQGDRDAARPVAEIQAGRDPFLEHGFFELDDAVVLGGSAEEMLGALPNEIPAEMRETKQKRRFALGQCDRLMGRHAGHRPLLHRYDPQGFEHV